MASRQLVALANFRACLLAGSAESYGETADRVRSSLAGAWDYLAGAGLLDIADVGGSTESAPDLGSDADFSDLYRVLNRELDAVIRASRPGNFAWRGRVFGWGLRRLLARIARAP